MAHCNTIFSQLLKLVPRHEFETLANKHHSGRAFRTASRWSQFVTMAMGQLSGRDSLRDIVDNLSVQSHRLYHLVSAKLSRSNLSRINEDKLHRAQKQTPGNNFHFKNRLYSLDASTIDVCLSAFPWADFRTTKSAIKLHVGLNHEGYIPEFVTITDGKVSDIEVVRTLTFPKDSIAVVDRGYNNYNWYRELTNKGVFFVTRLKTDAKYRIIKRHSLLKNKGLTSDQMIEFSGAKTAKKCPLPMRRIGYRDPESGKHYIYLTIHFSLFTFHFSLFTFHFSLFTFHFSLFTFHFSLFTYGKDYCRYL